MFIRVFGYGESTGTIFDLTPKAIELKICNFSKIIHFLKRHMY